ncbi:MAG: hypothetical protein H0Z39_10810 [Peptococcaceae bacterium]|nr:hypothetical protein [Peptococcaceae bacterium]
MLNKIRNKTGSGEAIGFLAVVLLLMFIVFNLTPPLLEELDYYRLTQIKRDALLQMELQGGWTDAIRDEVEQRLVEEGFDLSSITINATQAPVPYGQPVEIEIVYEYEYEDYDLTGYAIDLTTSTKVMRTKGKSVSFHYEK